MATTSLALSGPRDLLRVGLASGSARSRRHVCGPRVQASRDAAMVASGDGERQCRRLSRTATAPRRRTLSWRSTTSGDETATDMERPLEDQGDRLRLRAVSARRAVGYPPAHVPDRDRGLRGGRSAVARATFSALRTFVLPRASNDAIARVVFHGTRRAFDAFFAGPTQPYARRDRLMAYFGPVSLVVLPVAWLALVSAGLHGDVLGNRRPFGLRRVRRERLVTAHARLRPPRPPGRRPSRLQRGDDRPGPPRAPDLVPATVYGAFSRRELLVNLLEVRADSPPSPVVLITATSACGDSPPSARCGSAGRSGSPTSRKPTRP